MKRLAAWGIAALVAFGLAGAVDTGGFALRSAGPMLCSSMAPTISSGFGTNASVPNNNGSCGFTINVGTGGSASSGVVGLPTATDGWSCHATDITTKSTSVFLTKETAQSTTTATLTNYSDVSVATAWAASDVLEVSCFGY